MHFPISACRFSGTASPSPRLGRAAQTQHAYAAEHLYPYLHPGAKVLDVGSGSGYLAAVFHHLVSPSDEPNVKGKVVGIEHIPELVDWSGENLKKDGLGKALADNEIMLVAGDGRLGVYDFARIF